MAPHLFPEPGDTLRMVRTGVAVMPEQTIAEGAQGIVYRGRIESGGPIAIKWYRPSPHAPGLREALKRLVSYGSPHEAFAWPLDLVESVEVEGFGIVMPLIEPGFRSLAQVLGAKEQPTFRVLVALARELVDAFAALHARGVCYRDINFGNLLVDPDSCAVAIVDNDNIGAETSEGFVLGTLRFMAPEVIRYESAPSTVSDLHSLAVFLYYLLVHGHPLEGERVEASYNWDDPHHVSETELAVQHFGVRPLFVFDPEDDSNRPVPGDPMWTWWGIYPKFMQQLFVNAFTTGLHDASLSGRVTEGVWRRALVRLADCVQVCSCTAALFWDPDDPEKRCWHCGAVVPPPMLLVLPRHTVVLSDGGAITSHHLANDRNFREVKATVEQHPQDPNGLVMRNLTPAAWTVYPHGEGAKRVNPGQRLAVRPMDIDFGEVRATIRRAVRATASPS